MADWSWGLGLGSGILDTSASARDMRAKIALAMLMKKNAYPKTLGEGLSSIGDSLGDALSARALIQRAAEQSAQTDAEIARDANPAAAATPKPDLRSEVDESTAAPAPKVASLAPAASASASAVLPTRDPGTPQTAAAPAGFRPPPAYLASSLDRLIQDPTRRGYLGHLAGREAQSANEVSSTGAAGPFQFTRGTGRQYGLVGPGGDQRTDIDASIAAANRLTDDNAAVLTKALGREPTPGELALAHQQGAGTAAKMLLGTGNAPNYNLAVNNAGGLGPQAAAQKIMGYYGMPGTGGPRDNAAAILASRPPGPTDQAQEATFSDVMGMTRAPPSFAPTASAGRTGDVMSDMPPVTGALSGPMGQSVGDTVQQRQDALVPPGGQPVPPPPGPQVAQAAPQGVFPPVATDAGGAPKPIIPGGGFPPMMPTPQPQIPAAPADPRTAIRAAPAPEYVPRNEPMPEPPVKPTAGPTEQRLIRDVLNKDVDQRRKAAAQLQIEAERSRLNSVYENQLRNYEIKKQNWLKKQELETKYQMDLPQQQATTDKTRVDIRKAEQDLISQPGGAAPAGPDPRLGTDQSPQRTGPRIDPVPPGDIPERWVKQEGERIAKTKNSYEAAKPELTDTINIINKIREHPAKPYATGLFSGITAMTPQGKGFTALNEQLMGKNLVDAYQKLQGTGQIGEKEGQNFAKARARLTTATTEADYDDALKDLESTVRGTMERLQRELKMPVTAWQKTQNDDYAPDIGEIGKRGGRVVEYIGGDPSKDSSYRTRTPR